jgi:superfamily II RNA helicase
MPAELPAKADIRASPRASDLGVPEGRHDGPTMDTVTPLLELLGDERDEDHVYEAFVTWTQAQGLELYPAQSEAALEIVTGSNVILATPTGSGKSLVAVAAHLAAMATGRRSFYTAPIKALVSEKFFALCDTFGADNVGMLTGDASVNPDAPIICATAEVLANMALRHGKQADVGLVVMDEFHFYAEPDRGWAWQVPLLELTDAQFLLLSATLGDVDFFVDDLTRRTGRPTALVAGAERPVPLTYTYVTTPITETIEALLYENEAPIYVVHFTQADALERAQALMSINVCTRAEKDAIAELIGSFRFTAGFGKTLSRLVRHGIGVHHAGMLPRYRRLVETLAQAGLLKVICGTDTLGVGVNVPIRTVLLAALSKYDGERTRTLKVREFHQISGRAGRAGFDTLGRVVVQAPEHAIANEKALAKAGDDPRKRRQVVRKKPPEGFVSWGEPTYDRLVNGQPETLTSQFRVTHAMLLGVLAQPGDPFETMRRLLLDNHDDRRAQRANVKRAIAIYRSLLAGGVVERLDTPDTDGRTVRLTVDLPDNFALNQALAPFALAALELLDTESPTYALDAVSVIESVLEDPRPVISAQRTKARGEAVAAMKAEGLEYEERMELLSDVTHPRPLSDLLEHAYAAYAKGHPWVADHPLRPKSVVRDMWERAMSFTEYVAFYGLARSEGIVLRYLADAFRTLRQTLPDSARTEELDDLVAWLGELVRQVDSSLLDEWEALRAGTDEHGAPILPPTPSGVTANERAFRVLVRNAAFRRVELAARRDWISLGAMDSADGWDANAWHDALAPYFEEHDSIGTGPDARGPQMLMIDVEQGAWSVRQIFDDPAGDHDWGFTLRVDLTASDEAGEAVVTVTDVGSP